jgi:hypothetical protein
VLAALGAQIGLDDLVGRRADLIVAAGLLVTVAVLGPRLHARLFGARRPRPAAAPPSVEGNRSPDVTAASP